VPKKLARPLTLKYITLNSPDESQNERNRFKVRSHVVRERRRAHAENIRAIMRPEDTGRILPKDIMAKLDQKLTISLGEGSTAQSLISYKPMTNRLQPTCSSTDLFRSMLNVYQEPNNPYTLFSANNVDHFSPYPIEKRPVLTENLGRCKKFFLFKL